MKIRQWMMIPILGAALQLVAFSEVSQQTGKGWRHNQQGRLANLSPAERLALEAARQTAMQDPTVKAAHEKMEQARQAFQNAMDAAMLKADPSIQPLLGHNLHEQLTNLSPADEAARQTAMQDPTVQSAREEMEQARQAYQNAMDAAMLKADPSIQLILDKLNHE